MYMQIPYIHMSCNSIQFQHHALYMYVATDFVHAYWHIGVLAQFP